MEHESKIEFSHIKRCDCVKESVIREMKIITSHIYNTDDETKKRGFLNDMTYMLGMVFVFNETIREIPDETFGELGDAIREAEKNFDLGANKFVYKLRELIKLLEGHTCP